ncbi:unnamed protein product [Staurois parvus]|uniref:Secreted protein n=1 Tax=Staurois parvus TaxID=386267 RepID=A0ABN9D3B1_9NEOB|nr:unnamed protein product [Staurois parvus]
MILTLLTPAPAWARSLTYLSAVFLLWPLSSSLAPSVFFDVRALPLGSSSPSSTSSPVIGRLCASPELQFRWPISGEEAELLSDLGGVAG